MSRNSFFVAFVLVGSIGIGVLLTSESSPQAASTSLAWNTFDEGMALARQSNKKLLVDVYTDWCGWCKRMDSEVYTDQDVINALQRKFVLVKLNAESDKSVTYDGRTFTEAQFAGSIGVTGYPSTLFFESNGKPITLLPGFVPPPKFLPVLRYIGDDHYQSLSFEEYLSKTDVSPSQ